MKGGTTGATLGGFAGKNMDEIQNRIIDRELFVHKLGQTVDWIPDEQVSHCPLCSQEFTALLRKHHCRACGGVFCANCSSKKLPFRFENMQQERTERVCDECY